MPKKLLKRYKKIWRERVKNGLRFFGQKQTCGLKLQIFNSSRFWETKEEKRKKEKKKESKKYQRTQNKNKLDIQLEPNGPKICSL